MKFWGILFGVLGGLGLLGFLYLNNLHGDTTLSVSQKQKALANLLGRAPIMTSQDHTSWKLYKSPVMSFSYPSWATVYTKDNQEAKKSLGILDSFHFGLLDEHIEGIVAVVSRPSFGQVTDDSGVQLRLQDKAYQEIGSSSGKMVMFVRTTDTNERSLFQLQNGRIYSLIVSGGSEEENKEIFEKIYTSFRAL